MFTKNRNKIFLFADGSCGTGEDIGAWATLLCGSNSERKLLYGVVNPTTISRMELIPIIEGLSWLSKHWAKMFNDTSVKIYSDSEFVIKTASGAFTAHKNLDLWEAFGRVRKEFKLDFIWYSRNILPYMEICDATCSTLRRIMKETSNTLFTDYKQPESVIPFASLPE